MIDCGTIDKELMHGLTWVLGIPVRERARTMNWREFLEWAKEAMQKAYDDAKCPHCGHRTLWPDNETLPYNCAKEIDEEITRLTKMQNAETVQQRDAHRRFVEIRTKMRGIAKRLSKTMQCNCDLDNWEPEKNTGHSWVCRIHKATLKEFHNGRSTA